MGRYAELEHGFELVVTTICGLPDVLMLSRACLVCSKPNAGLGDRPSVSNSIGQYAT